MVRLALFDIDNTLIKGQSGIFLGLHMLRTGKIRKRDLLPLVVRLTILYRMNRLNYEELIAMTSKYFLRATEEESNTFGEEVFEKYLKKRIYARAKACIDWHKRRNHVVACISSTPFMLAAPIGKALRVNELLVNFPVIENGRFAGDFVQPYCFGEGKTYYAKKLAAKLGASLEESYFYTDSITDLPLLKKVGKPICVNPDLLLKREAKKRGWREMTFRALLPAAALNPGDELALDSLSP